MAEAQATTNHQKIREWVEEREGWPATVASTAGDRPGVLRIDFPGYSGEESLKRISWEAFFQQFEDANLAFLYQEKLESGETSRFFKFVDRAGMEKLDEGSMEGQHATGTPPMVPTKAAKEEELDMARQQGHALEQAAHHMMNEKAQTGAAKRAGPYLVGYAIEKAEPYYVVRDGKLHWQKPQDENIHIEILVRDGGDGRFVPALDVHTTVIDSQGQEVGTKQQPFIWHPWLYHYGINWQVPGDGKYTLHVRIEMPTFPRHDKKNGERYTEPVEVKFTDVMLKTGQKK